MPDQGVVIITTAHWAGDPRLNRHVLYLESAGHRARIVSFSELKRASGLWKALGAVGNATEQVVIMPDPELFLLGSLMARATGKLAIVDIHEDYPAAARARPWIPSWARPLVGALAAIAVRVGRFAASRVVVAAPQLAKTGDALVLNIPDPQTIEPDPSRAIGRDLVYVGDVTLARGAKEMVEMLGILDESFRLLVIGRVNEEAEAVIESLGSRLGVADRITSTGRLDHEAAWESAGGALAGLNLLTDAPAYRDAVATKLWEYMALGIPPIVSDLPGQAEVVGRLAPELVCATPAAAAAVAIRLAENPDWRESIAVAARDMVIRMWEENRPDRAIQAVVSP
jgi:glycosyltransferase involved in cell wall biosynthesis